MAGSGYAEAMFTSGVAAGDVTATRAVLWTRLDQATAVLAQVALDLDFQQTVQILPAHAIPGTDFTVKVQVDHLQPATRYYYRFVHAISEAGALQERVSRVGSFRTAPPPDLSSDVRFAYSGDSEAAYQPFSVLGAVRQEDPDFFIYLGDTIYADNDSGVGNVRKVPPQASLPVYRAKYRENRADGFLQDLLAATSTYAVWDDHEVLNDYAGQTVDPVLLANGVQAFFEHMPIRPDPSDPTRLFRSFRWGKDVELFILDERQYRSAERFCVTAAGELALLPALQTPRCFLTELAAPDRTILGSQQKAWLARQLLASDATFKFIVNEVPISRLSVLPYDRWEGYAAERRELLTFIRRRNIRNVIFLTTDFHLSFIRDVSVSPGHQPIATEIIVGPIATATALDEIRQLRDFDAAGSHRLVGLRQPVCVNLDTYSYGLVEVDSQAHPKAVTVVLKDQDGRPVLDMFTRRECRITIPAEEEASVGLSQLHP
jgi:alkaline phosphatase D